jgi:hypothetical protein
MMMTESQGSTKSENSSMGSTFNALAKATNSTTSRRRSPDSNQPGAETERFDDTARSC